MKGYEIVRESQLHGIYEMIVEWNGYSFLVMYGRHFRGWFISVPNWNVFVESSKPDDIRYNSFKLDQKFEQAGAGQVVALAVNDHYTKLQE